MFRTGRLILSLVVAGLRVAQPLHAQRASVADTSHFRALDLPAPNEYRSGSGRPGHKYWQQRADYRIAASLNPESSELRGDETIHYVNNSPDSLPYLWL